MSVTTLMSALTIYLSLTRKTRSIALCPAISPQEHHDAGLEASGGQTEAMSLQVLVSLCKLAWIHSSHSHPSSTPDLPVLLSAPSHLTTQTCLHCSILLIFLLVYVLSSCATHTRGPLYNS